MNKRKQNLDFKSSVHVAQNVVQERPEGLQETLVGWAGSGQQDTRQCELHGEREGHKVSQDGATGHVATHMNMFQDQGGGTTSETDGQGCPRLQSGGQTPVSSGWMTYKPWAGQPCCVPMPLRKPHGDQQVQERGPLRAQDKPSSPGVGTGRTMTNSSGKGHHWHEHAEQGQGREAGRPWS